MSLWPVDDPTEDEEPLHCPGCDAVGDAPCERGCVYAEPGPHLASDIVDRWQDEEHSSDRDPDPDPWEDIF
jgi:hypothetical protein